jgi:hypothetical protein
LERFHLKPAALIDYDEFDVTDIIESNTFDPYDTLEPIPHVREIRPLAPREEEEDSWLFCTMCYDDYPMHGESVCHSCHEKRENLYDYMI